MAFFLIGRGPDDDLRLLSTKPLESRQAAMAELSRLSAEPGFDQWDVEVSVMDLDTGVPVLLVRPAAATVVSPEPSAAETGDADAWEADLPAAAVAVPAAEFAPEAEGVPTRAAESVPDAIEAPFWEPPTVALIEPVGDEAIADAIVAEATAIATTATESEAEIVSAVVDAEPPAAMDLEPAAAPEPPPAVAPVMPMEFQPDVVAEPELVPWVEPEPARAPETDAVVAEDAALAPAADERDELRDAILRTTEHMSAEGIVPPESIGPAIGLAEDAPAETPEPVETPEPAVVETPMAAALELPETPLADVAVEQPALEESAGGFWPWNKSAARADAEAGVAPEVAGVYDALESPVDELPEPDVEAVLSGPATVSSYDLDAEPTAEPDAMAQEPMSNLAADASAVDAVEPPAEESDFILDLDSVESTTIEPEPLAPVVEDTVSATELVAAVDSAPAVDPVGFSADLDPAPGVSPLEDYTCEDCVHTETCPNRDQRLPKDCGSFQWR
jgi:hypothetical protein